MSRQQNENENIRYYRKIKLSKNIFLILFSRREENEMKKKAEILRNYLGSNKRINIVCGKCNESFILNQRRSGGVPSFQYKENKKRLKLK